MWQTGMSFPGPATESSKGTKTLYKKCFCVLVWQVSSQENELPLDHTGEPLVGGFFAVPKPPKLVEGKLRRRQRLIFDRRR